jgi:hypothetical protein
MVGSPERNRHLAMRRAALSPRVHELVFESFGVRVRLASDAAEPLARAEALLPPGWQAAEGDADATFAFGEREPGRYELLRNDDVLVDTWPLDVVLTVLERELRLFIAEHAPDLIFVHAGVVAVDGRAIVIPGETHSGKTSLVAALVRAGATYFSDEYAVLDSDGRVHPFAKPLSLRTRAQQVDHPVESLGGAAGASAADVGLVVVSRFQPEAEWAPQRLTPGAAAMELLAHTLPAQARPAQSMQAIERALTRAVALKGERGEADAVAPLLLAALRDRN